jgi:molecular chaperone GrpE (heat shock protein)
MKKLGSMVVLAATLGAAVPATAAPSLYPQPGNRIHEVTNPTKAVAISDTVNNRLFWVMPPSTGGTTLSGVFYSGNTGFCGEMVTLQTASHSLTQRIVARMEELDELADIEAVILAEITARRVAAAALVTPSIERIRALRNLILDLEDEIAELREQRLDCETSECRAEKAAEIAAKTEERRVLRAELRALENQNFEALEAYEAAMRFAKIKEDEMAANQTRVNRAVDGLIASKQQLMNMYRTYATIEGGFGNVVFDTGWEQAVEDLRTANAAKGFVFEPIPTSDVRVFPQLLPGYHSDNYLAGMPSVLDYTIAGRQVLPTDIEHHFASLPAAVPANMRLSLIGACPLKDPESWDLPKDGPTGSPLFGLRAEYQYESAFFMRATAKYNMWKIYEHVKTVSTSGGLFRSSTKVFEDSDTSGEETWDIEVHDEGLMSDPERKEVEKQIKAELLGDVLRVMAVPQAAEPGGSVDLLPAPKPGAVVFADGLQSLGWWSPYATGASWILRGLSAIFGGSNAEARYRQTQNQDITREYNISDMKPRTGVTAFH